MLDYAERLTRDATQLREGDIQGLRRAGLSDPDILDLTMVASYFNYINRIADALGVLEIEPERRGS
jgi:alkylhydroperoxidase family enzyme